MKKVSLIAALCFLLLPAVGLADTLVTFQLNSGTMSLNTTSATSGSFVLNNVTASTILAGPPINSSVNDTSFVQIDSVTMTGSSLVSTTYSGGTTTWTFNNVAFQVNGTVPNPNPPPAYKGGDPTYGLMSMVGLTGTLVISQTATQWSFGDIQMSQSSAQLQTAVSKDLGQTVGDTYWISDALDIDPATGEQCYGSLGAATDCSATLLVDTGSLALDPLPPPPPPTPEPATLSLLGFGLVGLLGLARRRRS